MQMQHCNKYQNNQNLGLPSGSNILPIYWSCRASAIYDLPINLRYIHKRVPSLVVTLLFFDTMVQWKILAAKEPVRKGEFFFNCKCINRGIYLPLVHVSWVTLNRERLGSVGRHPGTSQPYAQFAPRISPFLKLEITVCVRQDKVR